MAEQKTLNYASDVIDVTLGLKPAADLKVHTGQTTNCSHCARTIAEGEPYKPSNVGEYFSDTRDLKQTENPKICWRCDWARKMPCLYGFSGTVSTVDGLYPIHKDVNKAWLFLTPPPAPFVVTHSSSTMQHLLWRTPVTLDNRLIYVRFGPKVMTVQPEQIKRALALAESLNEKAWDKNKRWLSPLWLDRDAQDARHGTLNNWAKEYLDETERRFLEEELSAGEYWALSYLMHSKRPQPEKPEPTTDKVLAKLVK